MRDVLFIFIACYLSFISCNDSRRTPNMTEKQLLALINDTTSRFTVEAVRVLPDSGYVPPVGAKYTEDRSVDLTAPPITLKVSVPDGAKQPLMMSYFGSSVEYVVLRLPDDKDFFLSGTRVSVLGDQGMISYTSNTRVVKTANHYVTSDEFGIRLFNHTGYFIKNLLLSSFSGKRDVKSMEINSEGFMQASLRDIQDGRLYLSLTEHYMSSTNNSDRKIWIGEYDISGPSLFTVNPEISTMTSNIKMTQVNTYPSGILVNDQFRFSLTGGGRSRTMALSFNAMGDTLCKFTNHDRLADNVRSFANSDRSFFYRADENLFFRQAYCDTIFRVQSPHRIVPAYRFDFGALRVSAEDGVQARTQGKILPWKWIVLKNTMVLIFTVGRDCPNCRAAGEVTFHCLLFNKQTGVSTAIDMLSQYPEDALIVNDLDGGLPLSFNSISQQEDGIIASFTKDQVEKILKNNAGSMPTETVTMLRELADTMKQNEMLVMTIR